MGGYDWFTILIGAASLAYAIGFGGSQIIKASKAPDRGADYISRLLTLRHGSQDFFLLNTDSIRQTISQTSATLTTLIPYAFSAASALGATG